MKDDYISQIIDRLKRCNDLALLDLVLNLLDESIEQTS